MKAITYLIVLFCMFYYVQNLGIGIPGLDKLQNIHTQAAGIFMRRNELSNNANQTSPEKKSGNSSTPNLKNDTSTSSGKNNTNSDQVCYPPLGCFEKSYYSESNLPKVGYFLPSSPEDLDINIIHFTNLKNKGQKLKFNDTKIDNYVRGKKAYFMIHGWRSGFSYESWLDDMKDTVLQLNNGSVNVFVVDWSKFSSSPLYPLSAANTKLIGKAIGYFIVNTLVKNYGLKCEQVHVLGHSLGGQTAGFIGKYCKTQNCFLGRITGLDPAGPFFRTNDVNHRITKDDAFFVEIIHSNASPLVVGGLGTTHQSGMVDYWPNGGTTQAGCDLRDSLGKIVKDGIDLDAPSCSHTRAPQIYAVNFDRLAQCQLVAYQCKDYKTFENGECADCGANNSRCRLVGLSKYHDPTKVPPPSTNEKFWVSTTAEAPYCQHTYQIKVQTSTNLTSRAIGDFYLNLIGQKRDAKDVKVEGSKVGLNDNTTYYALLEKELPLEEIKKVEIYFYENVVGSVVSIASTVSIAVEQIQVNYMSHISPVIRKRYSATFVPRSKDKQISKSSKKPTEYGIRK